MFPPAALVLRSALFLLLATALHAADGGLARRPEIPAPLNSGASSLFSGAVIGTVLDVDRMSRWFTVRVVKVEGQNTPPSGSVLSITCKRNDRDQMLWVRDLAQRQQVTVGVAPGENRSLTLTQYPVPPVDPKAATPKERKKKPAAEPAKDPLVP